MDWITKTTNQVNSYLNSNTKTVLSGRGIWKVSLLSQGPHHCNFKIKNKNKQLVMRLLVSPNKTLDYGANYEYKILKYLNGTISPKVILKDFTKKKLSYPFFIEEFLQGKNHKKLSKKDLSSLAVTLAKLHSHKFKKCHLYPGLYSKYSLKRKVDSLKKAKLIKKKHPKLYVYTQKLQTPLKIYEKEFKKFNDFSLIHNDLHLGNILFQKEQAKLIDFHYARIADSAEDFAFLFALLKTLNKYKLSNQNRDYFLSKYINLTNDIYFEERLAVQEPLHKLYVALWYAYQLEEINSYKAHTKNRNYEKECKENLKLSIKELDKSFIL